MRSLTARNLGRHCRDAAGVMRIHSVKLEAASPSSSAASVSVSDTSSAKSRVRGLIFN